MRFLSLFSHRSINNSLFTEPKDETTALTDYLILQEYQKKIGDRDYEMIDRLHPEDSLLVQFALPEKMARVTHPKAAGYTPPTKVKEITGGM